jgi:hypothetical protein
MMVGFKYYSNAKVAAALFVSIAIIVFLVTIRADHLFFFALPKPVTIRLPPPTPSQVCSKNLSVDYGYTKALSLAAYSTLSNYTAYSSGSGQESNASLKYIKLLYSAMNSSALVPELLGTVSDYNLSSSYSASNPCSMADYNENTSQAEVLGVLLGYNISIFRSHQARDEFLALNIDTSLLPTPYWPNVTPLLSVQEPQPAYTALYSTELMNGFERALNATADYALHAGMQKNAFSSISTGPENASLGGMFISYLPSGENLSALSESGYLPQTLPLITLSEYSCLAYPYQSNAACAYNSTHSERRLLLYEIFAEQQAGYSLSQLIYHRSFNPSIAFAGYRNGSLMLEVANAQQDELANATISLNGKNYSHTRFLSYFYVNASLKPGYNNISFKSQNIKLSTTLYVNPEVSVSAVAYHANGSAELYLSNYGASNVSIYNLKVSNFPNSNTIVPVLTIASGNSTAIRFSGEPCNASTGPQMPIYVRFNSSKGNGVYYTTMSCG